ncbi:putative reductase [Thalassovita gelatinovora]|uniref:Putative reductase n=1 Tax=Thalassovita gelatinovora TaxID=53501 RepID=A0A0P1FI42_THAGE|nr:ArsC/Spx/MgsR family protein [Thalassovita gelatinovora]QIZ82111.1 arsenate reductase [Thalassovita gelatinovora]CUH67672.1 putative reductase [Thalassovita gelatinovora]SEP69645.1 arsenate reductase [Thalassovita gelatinovora]
MKIYGLKNCDTCRKAAKALPAAELVDIRATPLEPALRQAAHARFGAALLNTRSTTWRGLDDAERSRPALDLLADHPALMKRPLIVDDQGALHLGWGKDVQAALLGK